MWHNAKSTSRDGFPTLVSWSISLCLALTLLVVTATPAVAQLGRNVRFRHLSVEDGLSQEAVHAVLQDSRGLLWFGTQDGLNRYDGYDITVFNHDPKDPTSLSNGWIWSLIEDSHGNIWVGTDGGGLNRFFPDREAFERFVSEPSDPFSLSHNSIRTMYEDRAGKLWVGTDGGGLNRLDPDSRRFTRFANDPSNPTSLSNDQVRSITEDAAGALWIGTHGGGINIFDASQETFLHLRHDEDTPHSLGEDRVRVIRQTAEGLWIGTYESGLDRYDAATGRFTHFVHDANDSASLADDRVRDLFEDSTNRLWVATDGGLSIWTPATRAFVSHVHDPSEPNSLSDDRVNTVIEDAGGVLWVGTYSGLNKWNLATGAFEIYQRNPDAPTGLASDVITAFNEDADGNIWVGTYGGGLTRIDAESGALSRLTNDQDDPTSLADDRVMALHSDDAGHLWIGTYDNGLDRLDPDSGTIVHYRHDPDDPDSLSANGVTVIAGDRFGALWVGTYRGGLHRFDSETGSFAHYRHDPGNPTGLGSDSVLALHEDETGALWIGTDGAGLSRYDRRSSTFSHYVNDPSDPTSLSSNTPWAIHQDRRGGFWIGTQSDGLNYWDPLDRQALKPKFKRYLRGEGLPSSVVYGILEDDQDNLWLSTSRGLTRLHPPTGRLKNYDITHGLQGNDFNFGAQFRSRDGRMFFGGSNGFNVFHPEDVRDNEHAPPVVLTEFLKFNQSVPLGGLTDGVPIELSYKDSVVAFEFAALDFTAPAHNQYRYRLDGLESEWNELGDVRRMTYTNLEAGEYTLRVQASNNDGFWNEEGMALALVVGAPPWRAWWAILVYVLSTVGAILAMVRRQMGKLERQEEYSHKLEQEVGTRTDELESQNRELADLNLKLQEVSVTDSLTGLWNRRYLANEIPKDLAIIRRARIENQQKPLDERPGPDPSLLFLTMDLDGLKRVNDSYGHQAGDRAILQMKEILLRVCRQSDTLIRWGGDEFLLLGRQTDREAAAYLAERIRQAVGSHHFDLGDGDSVRLSCSIGFTFFPFMPNTPNLFSWEQVLDLADRALYRAKQAGRNQWVGVLSTPDADPAAVMKHKDDDLETLARTGVIELHTGEMGPTTPDADADTDRAETVTGHRPGRPAKPRLVSHAG